jgi:hypothetical protein
MMEAPGKLENFSLLGGPLHQLECRLGLVRGATNTVALGLALGLAPWLVLLALALLDGADRPLFSASASGVHARLLLAIPLFFLCESLLDPRLTIFVHTIVRSEVVPKHALPALQAEIDRISRWKDSWLPDATSLLAAVLFSVFASQLDVGGTTAVYDPGRSATEMTLAGQWYLIVCLTLFRFLMVRWLWRLGFWCFFLWRLSRLDLHLVPTHPDGTCMTPAGVAGSRPNADQLILAAPAWPPGSRGRFRERLSAAWRARLPRARCESADAGGWRRCRGAR